MQAVKQLQELGYSFSVIDGRIKYKYAGHGQPDEKQAATLLLQLKENKNAAMIHLLMAQDLKTNSNKRAGKVLLMPKIAEQAEKLVQAIAEQAESAGWTLERLHEYKKSLALFIPAKIGTVCADWIETIILHSDGTFRGSVRFYKGGGVCKKS